MLIKLLNCKSLIIDVFIVKQKWCKLKLQSKFIALQVQKNIINRQ